MTESATIEAELSFVPKPCPNPAVIQTDLRTPVTGGTSAPLTVQISDANSRTDLGLQISGFELVHAPSQVEDFYNCKEVMACYYQECKSLAMQFTGAHSAFTFDHVIREHRTQFNGGGVDGQLRQSGVENGGGYISSVHMDYTDRTTWDRYLELHGATVPKHSHAYVLNFWRPLSKSVDDNPLAVCDARTVHEEDLQPVDVYGYGADNYSWHNIGIETYSVSASPRHRWYYYPGMTRDDVLLIKSFDSAGVIGTTCPHGSFAHPQQKGIPRRSIELRVLCFC